LRRELNLDRLNRVGVELQRVDTDLHPLCIAMLQRCETGTALISNPAINIFNWRERLINAFVKITLINAHLTDETRLARDAHSIVI
jgi:hypothetical protein